ncbi:MAG: menD [Glaciihabitans sp.]|nr:menD [Glaciihabitans sp.]
MTGPAAPTSPRSPATDFSVALLDAYLQLGVRDVVLSPGSRSQSLALVAAEFEKLGLLRLRVRIDERVGGFLALGLAVETSTPVLVITTSGTAVANLHPAVLEAHHSGIPLIILSADRPHELRGIGSNQTTEQAGIFGPAITDSWDVAAPTGDEGDVARTVARESWLAATSGHRGRPTPVHVNLAFREPLSGPIVLPLHFGDLVDGVVHPPADRQENPLPDSQLSPAAEADGHGDDVQRLAAINEVAALLDLATVQELAAIERIGAADSGELLELTAEPGTVVVAGANAGEQAEAVARALGAPLLAEVTSGARFGPNLVAAYRELLNTEGFGDLISRVVVFGHPTLSREIPALLMRDDVTTIVVRSPGADDYNPGHRVAQFADAVRVVPGDAPGARAWVGRWVTTSRALLEAEPVEPELLNLPVDLSNAAFARRQLSIVREPVTRRMLVEAVWRATWPHDRLLLGASRLIREADQVVAGKKIRANANRGLAGIDGTIATGIGIALASQGAGPTAPPATGAAADTTPAARAAHTSAGTTRVLVGDVTALYDTGALLFGAGEVRPRIQVIVGNDGGGTIFDGLEVGSSGASPQLDRVMYTAQAVDFEKLAGAYGWEYRRVANRGELDEALTTTLGPTLIEVPLAR